MEGPEMDGRTADDSAAPAIDDGLGPTGDELAARVAREQYRESGIPLLEPDGSIAPFLAQAERLLGWREAAGLTLVDQAGQPATRERGPLYVTDQRLVHLGRQVCSIALADIVELTLAEDRLLVTLAGARGLTLDIAEPHQFRVLVAAAKSTTRA